MTYLLIPLFSILNRARGSRLFGLTNSTTLGRLVASFGMAFAVTLCDIRDAELLLPAAWGAFFTWMLPAWDAYWSAEIGNDPEHSKWWGLWHMALRMSLAAPAVAGVSLLTDGNPLWALATPLLALPYLIFGALKSDLAIPHSEYAVGALLGFLVMKAIA